MNNSLKISFIGGGNMAAALIGGIANKLTASSNIHVIDINADVLQKLSRQFGVTTALTIDTAIAQSDVIVLAVKPQQMHDVARQVQPHVSSQLILSIAAGIRAADLSRWLGEYRSIVRSMPNTPALIGKGITGMVALPGVSSIQHDTAEAIMQAVGATLWLENEKLIDAVTAVSGSGPAYVFYFIEAMQQAAQELGLTAEQSSQLALATFSGASELAVQSSESISVLRERVTSKGGTTYAAISSMEKSDIKTAIITAIQAASERGRMLGEEFGRN